MDKTQLLREFDELNRLLNDNESIQAIKHKYLKYRICEEEKKLVSHIQQKRIMSKSTVFLNLKKLNSVSKDSASNSNCGKPDSGNKPTNITRVFINPHFRKTNVISSTQATSKLNVKLEKNQEDIICRKTNSISFAYSKTQSLPYQKPKTASTQECGKSQSGMSDKHVTSSHKIFFNPQFSSSSKLGVQQVINTSSNITENRAKPSKLENCDKKSPSVVSTTKMKEETSNMNVNPKRKVIMDINDLPEPSTNGPKRKKEMEPIGNSNKIFVNPNFGRKETVLMNSKLASNESKSSDVKEINQSSSYNPSSTTPSPIPVLIGGKEIPNIKSTTYPLCTVVGLNRMKQDAPKATRQRVRTVSSSLVTVSRTKLVRKKSRPKIVETSGRILSQPLFVSKTKLVRNVDKIKAKQSNPRLEPQLLLPIRLQKARRRSLTIQPSPLKSGSVTKIRSKNGRTLKLIRKSGDTTLSASKDERKKTQTVINRKLELRQQANRIALSFNQFRLKKNPFTKINTSLKLSNSPNRYVNVFKKDNVPRKPLTKAALVSGLEETKLKSQVRNNSLDKTKFIRTKYRLIRKQLAKSVYKVRLDQKKARVRYQYKLMLGKKLKWKRKSDVAKRRLTRKDLCIKKIGGVFYRYSRTTLTKNKPSSKNVSQLPNKESYQALTGKRQNRYCINKYPAKRRPSVLRRMSASSSSRMTWKRTDYGSARSILKQAKKKSVYLLSMKLRKNNEPCLFYHRYGYCSGQQRGTCVRLHDKKFVAVCKKYLQGSCSEADCKLSHTPSCHNMPTCHHFLAGQCGRDNCVYPHIKVSDAAPICLDFLNGYCNLGDQCSKRHFEICPSFEKGACARGKYCPFPHPKTKTGEKLKGKFKHIKRKPQPPREAELVSKPSLRYFEDSGLQKENKSCVSEEQQENKDDEPEEEKQEFASCKRRPQLGELPSFIPLSQSFEVKDL